MTDYVINDCVVAGGKFVPNWKARGIRDGKAVHRLRISVPVQVSAAMAAIGTLCWSVFATAQLAVAQPVATQSTDPDLYQQHRASSSELKQLGVDPARVQSVGGPFEAVRPLKTADPKFKTIFTSWKELDRLEQGTIAIPSLKPVKKASMTSGFGFRSDPFRGRGAMHGGIDLAGPIGTPIYATADGYVGRSQFAGAYGNLIELDHGKGIQTRYAHMSKLIASAGQRIKRGDLIGLMGSTGRSTGSHLHYEVRIDGKAVNPLPFIQSNDYAVSVQARGAVLNRTGLGGTGAGSK